MLQIVFSFKLVDHQGCTINFFLIIRVSLFILFKCNKTLRKIFFIRDITGEKNKFRTKKRVSV